MIRNILVVCSGNICRSPMAEAILRALIDRAGIEGVLVRSAGSLDIVGSAASDNAVLACREIGVDITGHRSRALSASLLNWADVVLGAEVSHLEACRARAKGRVPRLLLFGYSLSAEGNEIDDPVGLGLDAFRRCRDILLACAERFLRDEFGVGPEAPAE